MNNLQQLKQSASIGTIHEKYGHIYEQLVRTADAFIEFLNGKTSHMVEAYSMAREICKSNCDLYISLYYYAISLIRSGDFEKAKAFMDALSKDTLKSLKEVNHELGTDIRTGSINTLIVKGLVVSVADGVEYTAKVVETRTYPNGAVIVIEKEVTKTETGYKLA